ncbi:MLO-like protein 1 [Dichanthelium oligosanthes]|uniref:MLO-like protein 1 n=1 Tax=Dichanthelium oligosanthes TaxID=888268 RepID=A0A1E5W530_9POAL|nr:MLO-like protein 1 [Dichanthelium oligosanthes]
MAGGGAKAAAGAPEITLEHTPTWIVASVCSVIVVISLLFERLLHRLGKKLSKSHRKPLYEALLKVKEELMLLGFISLMLNVLQGATQKICVRESVMHHLLPCPRREPSTGGAAQTTAHYSATVFTGVLGSTRRLLAGGGASSDYCQKRGKNSYFAIKSFISDFKGKVPILSVEAIHQLHIFIFVLAVTHVVLSAITLILGITQVIYGFKTCIMGKPAYVITRLVISVISQLLCGYSTLPLYAIISQMGSSFKKAMFDENISEGLANWAQNVRQRKRTPATNVGDSSPDGEGIQMVNARRVSAMEQGTARLI